MFPVLIRLAHSSSSSLLQRQSLLILRNLAFSSTHKARIAAEGLTRGHREPVITLLSSEIHPHPHVSCGLEKLRYGLHWTDCSVGIGCRCTEGNGEQDRESGCCSILVLEQSRSAKQQCPACVVRCENPTAKQRESPMLPRRVECHSTVNRRLASSLSLSIRSVFLSIKDLFI